MGIDALAAVWLPRSSRKAGAVPRVSFLAAVALRQAHDDVAMVLARAARGRQAIQRLVVDDESIDF